MSSFTNYGRKYLSQALFGKTIGVASVYYIAALKVAPNTSSTGSNIIEPTQNEYARVAVPNSSTGWFVAGIGSVHNKENLRYPTAATDWGWITHYAVCDSANDGNVILFNKLSQRIYIEAGDILQINGSGVAISVRS
jgi:hypothetical protein